VDFHQFTGNGYAAKHHDALSIAVRTIARLDGAYGIEHPALLTCVHTSAISLTVIGSIADYYP
jgi:hypothetical protein